MDLIITNVRLSDAPERGPVDIGIAGGRIAAIAPALAADGERFDAQGRLACAGFVETHIHLDKSRIIERCGPEEGREVAAVKRIRPLKPHFSVAELSKSWHLAPNTVRSMFANIPGSVRNRATLKITRRIVISEE